MASPSPRTICFVYFALLFGTAHANTTNIITTQGTVTSETQNISSTTQTNNKTTKTFENTTPASETKTSQPSVCTPATPESTKGQCIFLLPTGDTLQLVVVALTVGCFALLVTTLICICQVCHLRGIISSLQLHHTNNNIDLRAIRQKSGSPNRDEDQVDGQPTETCVMLSEVITAQEESREDEERVLENKDNGQPNAVKDPSGDVTQENSHEPEAKAPESSDTGV